MSPLWDSGQANHKPVNIPSSILALEAHTPRSQQNQAAHPDWIRNLIFPCSSLYLGRFRHCTSQTQTVLSGADTLHCWIPHTPLGQTGKHWLCWIPVVFLKSGAVSQPIWQLCRCVSKRQHLLHAFIVLAAPSEIHGQQRDAGRIPRANTYQACCSPGREADARSPQGGLCIQPWAFVLVSQVFPLNEAQGREKSQPYIFPVANVTPSKNSHFHSALADLGLGFI